MTYTIAIPSYNRSQELPLKTLATLSRYNVPLDKIHIFIVPDELDLYRQRCPGYQIIPGVLGLVNQRRFIESYFPLDSNILFIDDDLSDIFTVSDNTRVPLSNLNDFISNSFLMMSEIGATIWGIYPVNNTMFMSKSKSESFGLTYIVGAFYGQRNTRDISISEDAVEDRERTILRYLRDGLVLRFNHIGIKTKYFAPGGMMSSNRQLNHKIASEALVLKYPALVRLKIRKNEYTDCQIKNIK